ncbi:Ig-like domain-containing protein [Macrococcus sp. DPC7161]|uniref:Ig-like domain-containing protein n=1 Tax=Macrococcus sp. DPC7161 TaxID=2507060 RepID=UPI00100B4BF8|nr:Ig-like domain-containing protein [Macrococcus sp. DPC7161]RXK17385.1 hypothetical protein ER639_10395 [Macrococcus sp. DPC7161]
MKKIILCLIVLFSLNFKFAKAEENFQLFTSGIYDGMEKLNFQIHKINNISIVINENEVSNVNYGDFDGTLSTFIEIPKVKENDIVKINLLDRNKIKTQKVYKVEKLVNGFTIIPQGGRITNVDSQVLIIGTAPYNWGDKKFFLKMYDQAGKVLYNTPISKKGDSSYNGKVKFPKQKLNSKVYFSISDGNVESVKKEIKIENGIPPKPPIVNTIKLSNGIVSGKYEKGGSITLYIRSSTNSWYAHYQQTVKVDSKGNFKTKIPKYNPRTKELMLKYGGVVIFEAVDATKNMSKNITKTITDDVPPTKPSKLIISKDRKKLSGYGENGTTAYVYRKDILIGTGIVNSEGKFFVRMSKQPKGVTLEVHLEDQSGNESKVVKKKF